MGKPEAYVEGYLKKKADAKGYLCYKFTSPGHAGVPDRIIIGNGRVVFVELKSATGRLSALQKKVIADMQKQGADVRVINSREGVDKFLGELTKG